jgi:hypothetical protein
MSDSESAFGEDLAGLFPDAVPEQHTTLRRAAVDQLATVAGAVDDLVLGGSTHGLALYGTDRANTLAALAIVPRHLLPAPHPCGSVNLRAGLFCKLAALAGRSGTRDSGDSALLLSEESVTIRQFGDRQLGGTMPTDEYGGVGVKADPFEMATDRSARARIDGIAASRTHDNVAEGAEVAELHPDNGLTYADGDGQGLCTAAEVGGEPGGPAQFRSVPFHRLVRRTPTDGNGHVHVAWDEARPAISYGVADGVHISFVVAPVLNPDLGPLLEEAEVNA